MKTAIKDHAGVADAASEPPTYKLSDIENPIIEVRSLADLLRLVAVSDDLPAEAVGGLCYLADCLSLAASELREIFNCLHATQVAAREIQL